MPDRKQPTNNKRPTKTLDTVFLTGPGGLVYEFPKTMAEQHLVSMDRLLELGHLPIIPYGTHSNGPRAAAPGAPSSFGAPDVEGRHATIDVYGSEVYHSSVQFGTYMGVDGNYHHGPHYHPFNNQIGYPAEG